ncbi:MAG: hypothetical protein Q7R93_03900 [bacterium]|nr:hypothetical protein [bacterium]
MTEYDPDFLRLQSILQSYSRAFAFAAEDFENDSIRTELVSALDAFDVGVAWAFDFENVEECVCDLYHELKRLSTWLPKTFRNGWFQFGIIYTAAQQERLARLKWHLFYSRLPAEFDS